MQPLIHDLAGAYAARRNYVTIEVQGGGSDPRLQAVREGKADMEMGRRGDAEIGRGGDAEDEGSDLEATLIGWDAIAVVVNEARSVEALSLAQVRSIFAGELLEWAEAGDQAGEFVPVVQDEGSEVRALFEARVMAGGRVTPRAVVVLGDEGVARCVAQEPGAIGYLSLGGIGPGIRALALDGVLPEPETIRQGTYPLAHALFLVMGSEPGPEAQAFLEFVLSPEGQAIVGRRAVSKVQNPKPKVQNPK